MLRKSNNVRDHTYVLESINGASPKQLRIAILGGEKQPTKVRRMLQEAFDNALAQNIQTWKK